MVILRIPRLIERRPIRRNPSFPTFDFNVHVSRRFFRTPYHRVLSRRRIGVKVFHQRGFVHQNFRMDLNDGDGFRALRFIEDALEWRNAGIG